MLYFPANLAFVHPSNIINLPKQAEIVHESIHEDTRPLSNFILEPTDLFSDVCCGLDYSFQPHRSVTFCNMTLDRAGVDSTYYDFGFYEHAEALVILQESSTLMSEAAETPEKCAEYCTILSQCRYFSHDNRKSTAEPTCFFFQDEDPGPLVSYCCDSDNYADENNRVPGIVSGIPPRTRHQLENARVLMSTKVIEANPSTGFTATYSVSLGAAPKRGAVWVIPRSSGSVQVSFSPRMVALYNNHSTANTAALLGLNQRMFLPTNRLLADIASLLCTLPCSPLLLMTQSLRTPQTSGSAG